MSPSSGGIVKTCASSAAESGIDSLFCNAQDRTILHLTLNEMGHPQTEATPIYVDNTASVGISNNSIKKQRSRAMSILFFWVVDQVALNNFRVIWAPTLENQADYFIKHHVMSHHRKVCPYYLSCLTSPRTLARVPSPDSLQGCATSSNGSY